MCNRLFVLGSLIALLLPLSVAGQVTGYNISTAIGTGACCSTSAPVTGKGSSIVMPAAPFGMATDSAGNLFIAGDGSHALRGLGGGRRFGRQRIHRGLGPQSHP